MTIGPSFLAILRLNGAFAYAAFLFLLAHWLWSFEGREWWGFHAMAVVTALSAGALALKTLVQVAGFIRRDRAMARYAKQGEKPKGDAIASREAQRRAGMID